MLTSLKMDTITAGRGVWDQIMEQVAVQVSRGQVAVQVFMQVRAGVSLDAY